MGNSYVRQSAANIQDGLAVLAAPINAEFNALQSAFDAASGHSHDGTVGESQRINLTTSVTAVLPVANGGTGSSTAPTALSNLGALPLAGGTMTGVLRAAAGTVSLPGLVLSTDTSSGMYRIGADNIGYSIAGAKILDLSSTGLGVTGTLTVSSNGTITGATTEDKYLRTGFGRSGNGNSYLDLIGDATYSAYGLRLLRANTGANANSELQHRGTGPIIINAADAGSISIRTSNVEKLGIDAAGLVNLPIGQLSFPATQNPSSSANVLDDYEEGTWSPQMLVQTLSTGVVQSITEGTYIKIGRVVTVCGAIVLTNKGAGTGVITIGNLPFSTAATPANAIFGIKGLMGSWANISSLTGPCYVGASASSTTLSALKWLATAPDYLTNSANMNNNSEMYFTCTYIAAS